MRIKLLLILLLCSTAAFAQIQKQEGKLILATGDTLPGTITYFYDNHTDVIFYNKQGVKEVFASKDVKEIKLSTGERFVAQGYNTNEENTTLILQALIESPKISLYKREDRAVPYFYVSKDGVLYRLENNTIIDTQGPKTYKRKDNKYIGTLSSLMPDRMDLINKLEQVRLNETDLTRIISEYNGGEVSYYRESNTKLPAEPNLALFAQHSRFGSFQGKKARWSSTGQMVGLQYYFSKQSRHSVRASLDYSEYTLEYVGRPEHLKMYGLGLRYELAYKKTENFNAYMIVHVAEIAHVTSTRENSLVSEEKWAVLPLMSPGVGLEAKPLPRTAIYAELNNILQLDRFLKSFSVGLKYDFGKTTW